MRARWFLLGSAATLAVIAAAAWRWLVGFERDDPYSWVAGRARPHDEESRVG